MKIALSNLTTKNLAILSERVINSSENGKYSIATENHPVLAILKAEYSEYKEVYTKNTYSGMGKKVSEIDAERDALFNGIKGYLRGYCLLPLLPYYSDAQELMQVLVKHNLKLNELSYAEKSSLLIKLIESLELKENLEKLKKINLESSFLALKEKQTEFEKIYSQQAEANAELRGMESATSIRTKLEDALKSYFSLVTGMKSIEVWKDLYLDLNEIIKAFKKN